MFISVPSYELAGKAYEAMEFLFEQVLKFKKNVFMLVSQLVFLLHSIPVAFYSYNQYNLFSSCLIEHNTCNLSFLSS